MTTRYDRQKQANKHSSAFTEFALKELQQRQPPAWLHRVELGSVTEGRVIEGRQLRTQHFVDLHHKTCTYRVYQELGIPCEHALGCILQFGHSPQQYLPNELATETWKNAYTDNLRPVIFDINESTSTSRPTIQAPFTRQA